MANDVKARDELKLATGNLTRGAAPEPGTLSGTWLLDDAVSAWISLGGNNIGIPRGYEPLVNTDNFTTFTSPFAGIIATIVRSLGHQ